MSKRYRGKRVSDGTIIEGYAVNGAVGEKLYGERLGVFINPGVVYDGAEWEWIEVDPNSLEEL